MNRETRLESASLTGEIPGVPACTCADDDNHRWSSPSKETIDTVAITRWRCTCPHCQCDALHLIIDPTDTGTPQHHAAEEDHPYTGLTARVLAGLTKS